VSRLKITASDGYIRTYNLVADGASRTVFDVSEIIDEEFLMLSDPLIYVVDPNADERVNTEKEIATMGIELSSFDSIDALLMDIRRNRPGCIFTELQLGRMTVFHLLKTASTRLFDLPIVLLTSRATVPMAAQVFKAGAFDLIEKPAHRHQIWECAHRAFDEHTTRQQASLLRSDVLARLSTLTPEERIVLEMILNGTPNKRIAAELQLSPRTIVFRRKSLMRKMQAKSIGQLGGTLQFALGELPGACLRHVTPA
jgi:FixJ family two-component response regulator